MTDGFFERLQDTGGSLDYVHLRANEECLLAIPDAVAWCWTRKGRWRALINDLATKIERV